MNVSKNLLVIVVLTSFLLPAWAQDDGLAVVEGGENLEKVKRASFRDTYVNTGADFSKYNKLYLGDALFDYRDVGPAERTRGYSAMMSNRTVFGISDEDRQTFEDIVSEAFMKEIVKGKRFTVTDTIDDQTIIMRGGVVDIVSKVPPRFVGRSEVYLASVGEVTLFLEFLDGKTGEVLARISERRSLGSNRGTIDMWSMPANSVTIRADISRWATSTARRLRKELDDAIGE